MKVMPRSIAVRMMRMLSGSSICSKPRCHPPRPIAETHSPVRPSTRYGMSGCVEVSDIVSSSIDMGRRSRVQESYAFHLDGTCDLPHRPLALQHLL
jgi:hypothetical protein